MGAWERSAQRALGIAPVRIFSVPVCSRLSTPWLTRAAGIRTTHLLLRAQQKFLRQSFSCISPRARVMWRRARRDQYSLGSRHKSSTCPGFGAAKLSSSGARSVAGGGQHFRSDLGGLDVSGDRAGCDPPVRPRQYTWIAFGKRCEELGVRPSMGSIGDCFDNPMAESFFANCFVKPNINNARDGWLERDLAHSIFCDV